MTDNREILEFLISNIKQIAKQKLQSSGRGVFSGKMIDSIDAEIIQTSQGYTFEVSAVDYLTYIDEGVNGAGFEQKKSGGADRRFKSNRSIVTGAPYSFKAKKPPFKAIETWAKAKGLNPYAVQNSIYRKGIKGINFFSETIDKEVEKLADYIAEYEAMKALNNILDD